jgi:hypothetical protein
MRNITFSLMLGLALCGAEAVAAELSTGPVVGQAISVSCICSVVNTSPKRTIEVVVDIVNGQGTVADSAQFSIEPLHTVNNLDSACGSTNPHWCRVSGRFRRKEVRGNYCVTDNGDFTKAVCSPLR